MAKHKQVYVGVDIGTTEVRCALGVAADDGDNLIDVLGIGVSQNSGMRKGTIIHPEEVTNAINAALDEAERVSGHRIHTATLNVNGSHVESQISEGVVAISGAGRLITEDDRVRAEDAATIMQLPPNREIIQLFARNYRIDGQDNIKDPVGMEGVRLEVEALIMTGSTPLLRALESVAANSQLSINHKTVSSLAAAEAVLDREARESGSAVIDLGAGTTNIVVMDEGEVQHVGVIPVGGTHITNDLAIGLKIDLKTADKIKRELVDLSEKTRGTKTVTEGSEEVSVSLDEVRMIVEARLEELCEEIDKQLKKAGYSRKLPGGVILTGGGAHLTGMVEFMKQQLELPAHRGSLQALGGIRESVDKPEYMTASGLMMLDMLLSGTDDGHVKGTQLDGLAARVSGLFKRKK